MDMCTGEMLAGSQRGARQSREWVHRLLALLDAAAGQLDQEPAVHGTIAKAASLLRKQLDPEVAQAPADRRWGLCPWQARRVRAYIDSHIASPVRVADLCALAQLSEAHFSRAFRRTFGKSPHAFVIRRRVELAAEYMLQTEAPLSDIALQCGFTDQPHLCRHFRQITGHTPAAWRRAHSSGCNGERPTRTTEISSGQEWMQTERLSAEVDRESDLGRVAFDYLMLARGMQASYFGHDEFRSARFVPPTSRPIRQRRITDEDIAALYAHLMTLPAVRIHLPVNTVPLPVNVRALQPCLLARDSAGQVVRGARTAGRYRSFLIL